MRLFEYLLSGLFVYCAWVYLGVGLLIVWLICLIVSLLPCLIICSCFCVQRCWFIGLLFYLLSAYLPNCLFAYLCICILVCMLIVFGLFAFGESGCLFVCSFVYRRVVYLFICLDGICLVACGVWFIRRWFICCAGLFV